MDKAMLLMMIAQQAPQLIHTLKQSGQLLDDTVFSRQYGDLSGMGILNEAMDRQYDMGSLNDTIRNTAKDYATDSLIFSNSNEALSPATNNTLLNYAKDFLGPSGAQFGNPEFPSDGSPAIDPNSSYEDLRDIYLGAVNNEGPDMNARASAAKMLLQNPNIGLEDPSGIGALYDEVAQDYQNGEYDDTLRILRRKKK